MKKLALLFTLCLTFMTFGQQDWTVVTSNTTGDIWQLDYVNASVIWGVAPNSTTGNADIIKSTDGGASWVLKGQAGKEAYGIVGLSGDIACVATGPGDGSVGKILRTTDGGTTWTVVYTGASGCWFNFMVKGDGVIWALSDPIGTTFLIVKSVDQGATWTAAANPPTAATNVYGANNSVCRIGSTAWFGTGGASATTAGANKVYKSSTAPDGPWTSASTTQYLVGAVAMSSVNGKGLAGFWQANNTINATTDGGATWTSVTANLGLVHGLTYLPGTNYAWAACTTGIFHTSNNGTTWVQDQVPAGVTEMASVQFFGDVNVGLAGGPGGLLLRSNLSPILPVELTSFTAKLSGNFVNLNWSTATELNNSGFQVERKVGSGDWTVIGFKNGNGSVSSTREYTYSDDVTGLSGLASYRLKQIDFDGSFKYTGAVSVDIVTVSNFALAQNFPNPFNPSTVISYDLPKDNQVSLVVFNALGQEVATLVNGMVNAGKHNVVFDASKMSSGIYYAVLRVNGGEFAKTIKMSLMK